MGRTIFKNEYDAVSLYVRGLALVDKRKTVGIPLNIYNKIMELKGDKFIYEFIQGCIEDYLMLNGKRGKSVQLPTEIYEKIMKLKGKQQFIYEFIDRCIQDRLMLDEKRGKVYYCKLKDGYYANIIDLPCIEDPMFRCQFQACFQKVLGTLEEKKRGN